MNFLICSASKEDKVEFVLFASVYPNDKKIFLYYVNPMIAFSDIRIESDGINSASQIKSKLEALLDKKIDYTLTLREDHFSRIIDILGGVSIYFDSQLMKKNPELKLTSSGDFNFSGSEALSFLKLKNLDNPYDFLDRLNKQESLTLTLYDNLTKNSKLIHKEWLAFMFNFFEGNLSVQEFYFLFENLTENKYTFLITEMPSELADPKLENSKKQFLKIKDEIVSIAFSKFETVFKSGEFTDGEYARIEVLNGTETNGLAKRVKIFLNEKRIKVLSTDNASKVNVKESVIINRSGNTAYVKKISELLGINNIKHIINKESGLDLTVILGEDFEIKAGKN